MRVRVRNGIIHVEENASYFWALARWTANNKQQIIITHARLINVYFRFVVTLQFVWWLGAGVRVLYAIETDFIHR